MAKFVWKALWDEMDARPGDWIETTSEMYNQMLEVIPPRAMALGQGYAPHFSIFLVGEPRSHNDRNEAVYACFKLARNGRFYAKHLTYQQFRGESPPLEGAILEGADIPDQL